MVLAVVLLVRLRRNDGSQFNDDTGTKGSVWQLVSIGTRHRDMNAQHQDEEAFGKNLRQESWTVEMRQMRSMGWDDNGSCH